MNERILELAKQAGIKANSEQAMSPQEQLFAELIVQECMKVMIDNAPFRWPYGPPEKEWDKAHHKGITDSVRHVREHFGVEE